MFDRFKAQAKSAQELNLIPIMNLMMVLIPFLLLGAAFFHIGVIPTSLPTHTPASPGEPPDNRTVITLNMQIEPDKILVTGSAAGLTEEETEALSAEFGRRPGGGYDVQALQRHIERIKDQYPKSDTVVIVPDDRVKYKDLVEVLDYTREKIIPVEGKDPIRKPLFAVTVFSKLIKEEEKSEEEQP